MIVTVDKLRKPQCRKCVASNLKFDETVELESSTSGEAEIDMDLFANKKDVSSNLQTFTQVLVVHNMLSS